jgi:hypothetical protein
MFKYNTSSITTFNKSIDEAYKQGRAHRHLINTIQIWIEAGGGTPATERIKPWVLDYTQQDLPDRRENKNDSKDMQGSFRGAGWVPHLLQKSLLTEVLTFNIFIQVLALT